MARNPALHRTASPAPAPTTPPGAARPARRGLRVGDAAREEGAGEGRPLDRLLGYDAALLVGVGRWQRPRVTRIMRALTHLGDTPSWVVMGLFLAASGGEGLRLALLLGLGAGIATLLSQPLKRVCCRARPDSSVDGLVALSENPDAFSFPSGHTAAAFGVAVALAGQGPGLGHVALVLACAIGLSRIYLGAHYPLDVAAGVILGVVAGALARLVAP